MLNTVCVAAEKERSYFLSPTAVFTEFSLFYNHKINNYNYKINLCVGEKYYGNLEVQK